MSAEEASTFEKDPLFDMSIRMRKWDELAKEIHAPVIDLEICKSKSPACITSGALKWLTSLPDRLDS